MLSQKLKTNRKLCGLTQQQVAHALGIERSTYSYYELGKTEPDLNTLKRLASIFGKPLSAFVDCEDSSTVLHEEGTTYSTRNVPEKAMSMAALEKNEQALVLIFRQLNAEEKNQFLKHAYAALEKATEDE